VMAAATTAVAAGCLKDLTFALELGLGVPFKKKQEINRLIGDNGGRVSYMINKKVCPSHHHISELCSECLAARTGLGHASLVTHTGAWVRVWVRGGCRRRTWWRATTYS
jgi:hypothetical protein